MIEHPRYPKPESVLAVPPDRHAIFEAWAGTGKTHTIEHLVVDLLIVDGVSLPEILVLTPTEIAARDLATRIRARLAEILALDRTVTRLSPDQCWVLNDEAKRRLEDALADFDAQSIVTFETFCRRVLAEDPLPGGLLFEQCVAHDREVFTKSFRETLPRLSVDPELSPLLSAWLVTRRNTISALEELLYQAARRRDPLEARYDPEALLVAARGFPALGVLEDALPESVPPGSRERVRRGMERLRQALASESAAALVAQLDGLNLDELRETLPSLKEPLDRLTGAVVPLPAAIVSFFLPHVLERVHVLARESGLVGMRDLPRLLSRSLDAPKGDGLARRLRSRYRAVLVDDFQQIDAVDWEILSRLFVDAAPEHPLRLVADRRQAIGVDERGYAAARERVAAGGALVHLTESFRATSELLRELNRIFDPEAAAPFFDGGIGAGRPFVAGRPELGLVSEDGAPLPAVVLLRLPARDPKPALLEYLCDAIVRFLRRPGERLRFGEDGHELPLRGSDVMILTRTLAEAEEVINRLTGLGIESGLHRQEGLFRSREAEHLRDLFAALADPESRWKRARAWTTPFFGVPLAKLAGLDAVPPEHPLKKRLSDWRSLAARRDYDELAERILEDSGLRRRAIFSGSGERALASYERILDLLLVERGRPRLGEIVEDLERFVSGRGLPAGSDANVLRSTSGEGVRVVPIHRAQGLEAPVVFLYALSNEPSECDRAATERDEARRLLYLALTRASGRLYLPLWPDDIAASSFYAPLNRRLTDLESELSVESVVPARRPSPATAAPSAWAPPRELFDLPDPARAFEGLKTRHQGRTVTSESRLARYMPIAGETDDFDDLGEGTAMSTFLAEALELVDLETLHASENVDDWRRRDEVAGLLARLLARSGVVRRRRNFAERLVYRALTSPLALGERRLERGLASVAKLSRGVRYVLAPPSGKDSTRPQQRYVRGRFDVVFEHESRVYLCEWESEKLDGATQGPGHGEPSTCPGKKHRMIALVDWLGIGCEEDYERRFGGVVHCYAPDLPDGGVHFERPSWETIESLRWGPSREARG